MMLCIKFGVGPVDLTKDANSMSQLAEHLGEHQNDTALAKTIAAPHKAVEIRIFRRSVFGLAVLILACGRLNLDICLAASSGTQGTSGSGRTINVILPSSDWSMSPLKDENAKCPDDPVHDNRENWEAQFPPPSARQDQLK